MKLRFVLLAILLVSCISSLGQQKNSNSAQKPTLQELSLTIVNQQKDITELKDENDCLKQQLVEFEKEVDLLKSREDFIDDKLSHWLTILSISITAIVTILGGSLGVIAPLYIKRRNDKKMDERIGNIKKELEEKITTVQTQAEKAASSLSSIEEIKEEIKMIKTDIDESKKEAEQAATEAKASELFSKALNEKDNSKAIDLYSEYLQLVPNSNVGYFNRAVKKSSINDLKGAIEDYTKAIQIDPNDYMSYCNRGVDKQNNGDLNGAMDDFNKAIEINPDDVDTLINRGDLKCTLNEFPGALEDYNKAIEIDPENGDAFNNRGDLYSSMGDYNKAIADINRAIEIDNNSPIPYITKGEIKLKTKNYDEAIVVFSKALSNDTIENEHKKIALSYRAKCYRLIANDQTNDEIRKEYIDKAMADEKEASSLS